MALRERDLVFTPAHGELVAHWLTERDRPWLRDLCLVAANLVGLPRNAAERRLREAGNDARSARLGAQAARVLCSELRTATRAGIAPGAARLALARAAVTNVDRRSALDEAAARLGVAVEVVTGSLLADLPGQRIVQPPAEPWTPHGLALRVNLAIARAFLRRARAVQVRLCGNARAIVRLLRLHGTQCEVRADREGLTVLHVPGPLAALGHRARCSAALSAIVPALPWCEWFLLQASVEVQGQHGTFAVATGDPLPAGPEPRPFDSAGERELQRDFVRTAPDWELLREPEAVSVGASLHFPDFAVRHRRSGWSVLLELAGFWTPDYLRRKLTLLAALGERLILCVDERLGSGALPAGVLRFSGRLRAADVLAVADARRPAT
jgi:predicted nuclease of restriction endonuclease-like RecB superfamily